MDERTNSSLPSRNKIRFVNFSGTTGSRNHYLTLVCTPFLLSQALRNLSGSAEIKPSSDSAPVALYHGEICRDIELPRALCLEMSFAEMIMKAPRLNDSEFQRFIHSGASRALQIE